MYTDSTTEEGDNPVDKFVFVTLISRVKLKDSLGFMPGLLTTTGKDKLTTSDRLKHGRRSYQVC